MCFNGGVCESEQYNINKYRCLCPQDPSGSRDVWAGQHCETPATDFCEEDVVSDLTGGVWFCTRGGNCKNGEKNLAKKCDCPEGTFGLHCEYEVDQTCNLECENDGVCKVGLKDFTKMDEYGLDIESFLGGMDSYGEHCVCPEGYTGLTCDKEEAVQCGQGVCFNGAECVQTTSLDGSIIYSEFCRCPTDPNTGMAFASKFCEHKATVFCEAPVGHDKGEYFCANGGTCPGAKNPHMPCSCPDGFTGPKCEVSAEAELMDDCDLKCENGGECFFGQSPIVDEDMKELALDGYDFLMDNKHCRCPEGFLGLRCEMRYERCGANEHFCLHGSGCVPDNDQWTCDCTEAATLLSKAYAGEFCEHAATDFCDNASGTSNAGSFCANHGSCLGIIGAGEDHIGCQCEPGWVGKYCEYESLATDGVATRAFAGFVGTLGGIVLCFGIVIFLARTRGTIGKKKHEYRSTPADDDVSLSVHGHEGHESGQRLGPIHVLYEDNFDSDLSDEDTADYEFKDITII